jgi:hypothetical protein
MDTSIHTYFVDVAADVLHDEVMLLADPSRSIAEKARTGRIVHN